jgi:branched-chain amino acid aminotransferase
MKGLAYINGNFVSLKDAKVSILDRGFRYGEGIFETICIEEGKAIFLKEHFERLKNSSKALNLDLPLGFEQVADITRKLIQDSSIQKGVINIYLTKTEEENRKTNFLIVVKDEIRYKESDYEKGYTAIISSIRINSSLSINSHKTLSFLYHILAKKEAKEKGADEAILLNTESFVLEGTTRNIFMVKGNKLITPPLGSGILPGITRAKILQIAPSVGLEVEEKLVKQDFLKSSDEVFITSSIIEVMPVVKIDDTLINNGKIGQHAVILREEYRELI